MSAGKPADRRQRANRPSEKRAEVLSIVAAVAESDEPPRPRGLLKVSRTWWSMFWASPLSKAVEPTDVPALERLVTLRDQRERALRVVRRVPFVKGSTGQDRLNPLYDVIKSADAEIRQLEDRFGMSPKSRMALGLAVGQAGRQLAELERFMRGDSDEDENQDFSDPR